MLRLAAMPRPIGITADEIDLSSRFLESHAVVGSPAGASETTVCSLTIASDVVVTKGIFLEAWVAVTVGTNGVSLQVKIHHTNSSGATIADTGAVTAVATDLYALSCQGVDAVPVLPGQIYIVTLTVASGSATSTVSAVSLFATIV